jgi:IS5 family transposase
MTQRQSIPVSPLDREIALKMTPLSQANQDALGVSIEKAKQLIAQMRSKRCWPNNPSFTAGTSPNLCAFPKKKLQLI